jgi:predicted transcriptional regulator
MAEAITIRTDDETEHALDVLTSDGMSRSAVPGFGSRRQARAR